MAALVGGSMMSRPTAPCPLQDVIERGEFYELDEDDLLHAILDTFPSELDRLKNAYAIRESSDNSSHGVNGHSPRRSPSELLYGQNYDEINRTLVGVLALRWIHNDDYDTFTAGQPSHSKLHRESFDWLRQIFDHGLRTSKDVFALVVAMVINDLGKDPNLETDYYRQENADLHGMNHDMILYEAAKAGMVPAMRLLDDTQEQELMMGLELGTELNAGQLAQAENVPINLEGLLHMRGHEHAFEMKFMEQILDVAGAAGHVDSTCARKLIEPVFQAFKTVREVSLEIIEKQSSLREGYDKVLTKRGDMLSRRGFRHLSVSDRAERALLRLLTMGRTATLPQAKLFASAFDSLDPHSRTKLIDGLNVDGDEAGQTAILPYYMPAMLSEGLDNTKSLPLAEQTRALASLMRYLARVLEAVPRKDDDGLSGVVIERNVMKLRETISSQEFRANPAVLDGLAIPDGRQLLRRRTSASMESQPGGRERTNGVARTGSPGAILEERDVES